MAMREDLDPSLLAGGHAPEGEGGRYSSVKCLGIGSRVETFLVKDLSQGGREVVRKFFKEEVSRDQPDLVRHDFFRLSQLDHPALARVLDYGWEGEKPYICFEGIPGMPLLEALKTCAPDQALDLILQLVLALEYLFSQNILHLELKPSNLLVLQQEDGSLRLKMTDYGLCQLLYRPSLREAETVGTAPFTAPEYALRRYPDVRADLYSVGIYLFYALTKKLPFEGREAVKLLQAQLKQDAPPVQSPWLNLAPDLAEVCRKLLDRNPQERYADPHAVFAAITAAIAKGFPKIPIQYPPLFSNPELVFKYNEHLKIFRKIILQGGRWAIVGPPGSGKTFFSRWLERLFWLNQKRVFRFSGPEIGRLEGERGLNPGEPTFLLIDDAEMGPVESWLQVRPYQHVILFGREIPWAGKEKRWQTVQLQNLDLGHIESLFQSTFGKVDAASMRAVQQRSAGLPLAFVQQTRALQRWGAIKQLGSEFIWDGDHFNQLVTAGKAEWLASPLQNLPELPRQLAAALAFAQAPLRLAALAGGSKAEPAAVEAALQWLHQQGLAERLVFGGEIYFRTDLPSDWAQGLGLDEDAAEYWIDTLRREEFFAAALKALLQFYSPAQLEQPRLLLKYARLLEESGYPTEVFRLVTANFVNQLPGEDQALAYQTLGSALLKAGRVKQADGAFQRLFTLQKKSGDPLGLLQATCLLGRLHHRAGEVDKAVQFFQEAYPLVEKISEEGTRQYWQGYLESQVASLYASSTDFEQAKPRFESALQSLASFGPTLALIETYFHFADMSFQTGEIEHGGLLAREGLHLAIFKNAWELQGRIYLLLARIATQQNESSAHFEALSAAVFVLAKGPPHVLFGQALVERAGFLEMHRQMTQAQADTEKALALARQLSAPALEGQAQMVLSRLARRDPERMREALDALAKAKKIFEAQQNFLKLGECEIDLAELHRQSGDIAQARVHYQGALKWLDEAMNQVGPGTQDAMQLTLKKQLAEMSLRSLG